MAEGPKQSIAPAILIGSIVILGFALFYGILQLQVSGLIKFVLVVAEMLLISRLFIKTYGFSSELGMILLKGQNGINIIERLAQSERAFNFMADVGSTMAYGLLSFVLMRKNFSLKTAVLGFACLAAITIFVAPTALVFLFTVVKVGAIERPVTNMASETGAGIAVIAMLVIGGLFLFILSGIVMYGVVILDALAKTLFFGSNAIATTSAGGTFLLPGINLPLFEGIIALGIVLIVHEGSHAVLTRIAKVPILSSGLVLFGVIPMGAFVEPDEKKLSRVEQGKQTRVIVAGPTANLLTAIIFFILFMGFYYSTQDMREIGYLVYSGMDPGTIIHSINGVPVDPANYTNLSLKNNTEIKLGTNFGDISKMTNGSGKMGITFSPITKTSFVTRFKVPGLDFLYVLLGLTMSLNFVVGAVNILPVPLFDGGRLIDINVRNKTIVRALSYATLFFLLLNFLPLLFK
jgi:membrane-associated protease RseP (regulator of RpoE activity)